MFFPALFLNDVAGSEIVVIFLVILLFFGSKSIPSIAKTMGRALFEFRNATNEIKNEIKKSSGDLKGDLNMENFLKESTEDLQRPLDQVYTEVENAVHYDAKSKSTNLTSTTSNPEKVEVSNDIKVNESHD